VKHRLVFLWTAALLLAPIAAPAQAAPPLDYVPSSCAATEGGYRCTVGPFDIADGERIEMMTGVAAPSEAGYITWGQAGLSDAGGRPIEHHMVHLHHAVWLNPYEKDMTCPSYDGGIPGFERFFASGKELTRIEPPDGYGYLWDPGLSQPYTGSAPWWGLVLHIDGMHGAQDFYVDFDMGFVPKSGATDMIAYRSLWLDVRNCESEPVYSVEAGSGRRGRNVERWEYVMPEAGRIVALGGHLHDGGLRIGLANRTTKSHIFTSRARYGLESEPWYLTRMTTWVSSDGASVAEGDVLSLRAVYDSRHDWDEVMGIMVGGFVPD
jgi:hypothetical protein